MSNKARWYRLLSKALVSFAAFLLGSLQGFFYEKNAEAIITTKTNV